MIVSITAIIIAILLWYAIIGRAWLKTKPPTESFFSWIEPAEIALYRKSETLLIGRLLSIGAGLVTAYDTLAAAFSSLDLTPLTTRIFDFAHVPQDMRGIAGTAMITGIGLLISWLRKRTTKPVELIEVPEKSITPKIAEAIAMADATKTEAVAAVTEAKAA